MVVMRFKVIFFFLLLLSLPSLLAVCQQSEGDVNGDSVVNAEDITWIKDNPSLFWSSVLQEEIINLNLFISQTIKHFDSSCHTSTMSVLQFDAKGDGITNDGPAFQKALDTISKLGDGSLFIPAGTYFIDQTLVISDNTEIFGEGEKTILKRGDTPFNRPLYRGYSNCETNVGFNGRELFSNEKYNCGNSNIFLHHFAVDGSLVKTVPLAVALSFSAVKNLRIEHLTIRNVAQDGIFVKNGGVNTVIAENVIDTPTLRWFNGAGINVEMHKEGNFLVTSESPVRIERNTIILQSPPFCKGSQTKTCSVNTDCSTGCGSVSNVVGIGATWIDGEAAPVVRITDNVLKITNGHTGIVCHGCRDSLIENNNIDSMSSNTLRSELFTGINSEQPGGGYGRNVVISKNTITGSGKPGDGRAILFSSNNPLSDKVSISNNVIARKNMGYSLGALGLRGYHDFQIEGNVLTDIAGGPGIEIGNCGAGWVVTENGLVTKNSITLSPGNPAHLNPITLRRTQDVSIIANLVSPDGKAPVDICD